MKTSLNHILFSDYHVVTKIVKSEFIIGNICDVAIVCCLTLFLVHVI